MILRQHSHSSIEFARTALGLGNANSTEFMPRTMHPVIDMMEEQKNQKFLGGTMRLGAYECVTTPGSLAREVYGTDTIHERHRHRYELNDRFLPEMEKKGMKASGRNPQTDLVEIVEVPANTFYIGTQFHPEYSSTVLHPHPLFMAFLQAPIDHAITHPGK